MLFSQDRRRSGFNIFVLDHTALEQEPLHIAWSRRELCKDNAIQYHSSIVVSMCHGAIPVCWHTIGLGENYDQTGSGAPEAKKSRLAMNYFGSMVHKYSGS
jgi:hypothetical protein